MILDRDMGLYALADYCWSKGWGVAGRFERWFVHDDNAIIVMITAMLGGRVLDCRIGG